jgi:hypothetical protein
MGDALGDRPERLDPVQAATAEDDQVRIGAATTSVGAVCQSVLPVNTRLGLNRDFARV